MSPEANVFEISDIQEDESENIASPGDQCNNALHCTENCCMGFLRTTAASRQIKS
jgi:hypothetical protein